MVLQVSSLRILHNRAGGKMVGHEIRRALQSIEDLPALPVVMTRVLEVVGDSGSSAKTLSDIISYDQAITARVLRLANSALYGFPREITTVHQAVVMLGFNTIRNLVMGISVYGALSMRSISKTGFDRKEFWIHSVGSAIAAKLIAKEAGFNDIETPFAAGLLHDIGRIVLDCYFHEEYEAVLKRAVEEDVPLSALEQEILEIDHAEVGGWLADRWLFPPPLINAIMYHHNLAATEAEFVDLTAITCLANALTKQEGIGLTYSVEEALMVRLAERWLQGLGLSQTRLAAIRTKLNEEREAIEDFFLGLSGYRAVG